MTLQADILSLSPTHYITFNDVVDRGSGTLTDVLGFQNGAVIDANPITKNDTGSLSSGAGSYDAGDSNVINLEENLFQVITYICFANLTRVDAPTVIIKTGGLNNNMAIVGGFGAGHQAMANAGGQFFLNAYSTRTLEVNRSYFFALTWERGNQTGGAGTRCRYYLNGALEGEAVATNTQPFPRHNANFGIGNSDSDLYFYGGQLPAATNTFDKRVAHWAVFRDVLLSQADLFNLFAKWSIATYIVTNQTELDAVPNEVVNQNIGIEVNVVGSITLDFSTKIFQSNDIDIRYEGTGTLTAQATQSLNTYATNSGIINIVAPTVAVTISPLISGSRLKIYDTGTTTLVDGVNSSGTSFSFSTGTASQGYDIYIVNPGQKSVFINNYIYPSSSATLPVEQTADINYSATAGAYDITLDGSGIGVSADLWLDTANVEIQLATGNNLSQPTGISLQNLYSFIIESRYSNDELIPYHDPVVAISATAGEFELRRGWHLKDNTTRNLLRDGGLAQYSAANALEIEWLNITGLGNLATAATPYYWQSDVTNPTIIDSINSGLPNQLVQIFGDASNGNFDLRTFLRLSIRAQGENTVTYDLAAEQDLSSLNPQRYFIPLTTTANPNITIADTAIDANSDGAADIAPFDGMSVTYLDGTGFTAWANSTVYAANAVVSDGGRWYITTAGGTSSGTGVGDDAGVTWAAYSGERQIDGSYYAFNIIYDANNGTLEQMTAYLFWLVRQDVDIDAGSANRTGRAADRIATTRGSDLIMATGGVIDNFANAAQLTHIPVDVGGTERPYPAPPVGFSAANVADGSRFFLAHEQTFTVAAADINTADNDITLGNDNNGDAAAFASSSPYTTVHVNLTSGATMPTTSPQIVDGGRYYATVSSGDMQLFSAESDIPGNPISFSDQGTDSSGSVFTAAAETELYNASVSGGSGVFQTLPLSNGASVLRKAIYWDNSGTTTATPLFIQRFTWSATAGVSDPQVVNVSSEVDTIHNRIISLTNLELDGEIKNASGVGVTSVTPTNDGSSLSSVYGLVLEGGGGKLQVNSNDSDGIAIWQDLYAWGVFVTSTESGIRLVNADTFTAVNLRTFDLKNLQFDNISSTPLAIVGGIARTIDGSSLLAQPQTGSGGIAFNALALGTGATVETGVSGLTSGEAATLAKLDDLTELDGVIYRFTANALEQAPSGGGGGDATAANQTSIINTLASIQGPGFIEATDSLEAIRDRGDTNWITATGFSTHSAADVRAEIDANSTQLAAILANTGTDIPASISALNNISQADIRTAVGLSSANLDAQLGDIPTVSEFNARTLASADYFDPAADTVANVTNTGTVSGNVGGVVGVTFPASFNNLSSADVQTAATASLNAYNPPTRAELTTDINSILTQGNASWATADVSGLSTFNAASDQVIVATNNDKTGYSLTQAFPSNFSSLAIDSSGQVTAGNMRGTDAALTSFSGLPDVTVGGYAAGQAPNELIDISGLALEASVQSCLSAATAIADGQFVNDYTNSTATQYNTDNTVRTVFNLYQADGVTAATSAQDAVERRPQ